MQIFKYNVNYTWRGEGGVTKNACARAENMPFAHGQEKCISIFSEYPPTHDTKYEYTPPHLGINMILNMNIV